MESWDRQRVTSVFQYLLGAAEKVLDLLDEHRIIKSLTHGVRQAASKIHVLPVCTVGMQ